jgi:uncharacterized membrane protein YdbT with pleckstrin-like domain
MINFDPNENIVKVVRKHWFVVLGFSVSLFLLALLPVIFYEFLIAILKDFLPAESSIIFENFARENALFVYMIWLLCLWIVFFIEWTDYYLDAWIITDKRIIDVEQRGFFHRHVTSFRYEQIQDISVDTRGIIPTMFKYGILHIHTAGSHGAGDGDDIVINHADKPEEIRAIIIKEQDRVLGEGRS